MGDIKILLIEDDEVDAELIRRSFKRNKLKNEVLVVTDGSLGIDAVREHYEKHQPRVPLVVLLDLNLPIMNGHEFLRTVRSDPNLRPLIVFVVSTSDDPSDTREAYANNVAGYLVKGKMNSDPDALYRLISEYIDSNTFPN